MNENTLLKISLIFTLIGILTILFLTETTEIKLSKIEELKDKDLDEKVRIKGKINTIGESPGLSIINIEDNTGKTTIIIYKEKTINLTKNQIVEVIGTLVEYKDQLEIIADEVLG